MAKQLTDKKREEILSQFHIGKSQNQLAKEFGVSPATINKLCKGVEPKLKEKVNAQVAINRALATESEYQVNAFDKEVNTILRREQLVYGTAEIIVQELQKSILKGKAQKVVTVNQGGGMSSPEVVEYDLQPEHYEKASNAVHKAGVTLGVVDTKSNIQVENNIQNNQITKVEVEFVD